METHRAAVSVISEFQTVNPELEWVRDFCIRAANYADPIQRFLAALESGVPEAAAYRVAGQSAPTPTPV